MPSHFYLQTRSKNVMLPSNYTPDFLTLCLPIYSIRLTLHPVAKNWITRDIMALTHVAHCCCSPGTPKIIPASAKVSHWQHSNAARIIHSRVLSREHRAELEFRRRIAAINNNYSLLIPAGSDRMHHICTCFWFLRTHHALSISVQFAIRRVTAFNNYKGSLQMWSIDLIQQINKQVLHDFVLYHQRK